MRDGSLNMSNPAAACQYLREPLAEAALQLQLQVMHALRGQRSAMHTLHSGQKTLVALTRFFPPAHPVYETGSKLARIWPPAPAAVATAAGERMLQDFFRLLQELGPKPVAELCQCLLLRLQQLEAGSAAADSPWHFADFLRQLRQLQCFVAPAEQPLVQDSIGAPVSDLHAQWRYCLHAAAIKAAEPAASAPAVMLAPFRRRLLLDVARLVVASDGTLTCYCTSGLAVLLRQSRALARFCMDESAVSDLLALEDDCLDFHLAGEPVSRADLRGWLARCLRLLEQNAATRRQEAPRPAQAPDPRLRALLASELERYRAVLQELLIVAGDSQGLTVSESLFTALYKLTWVLNAVACPALSRVCHCAYQLCMQYWRLRRALPLAVITVLQELATRLAPEGVALIPAAVLRAGQWHLLQAWPQPGVDGKLPIALAPETQLQQQVVSLDAVPLLLSGAFATLVQVERDWFEAGRLTDARRKALQQELAMLEKGAAAMKVWPLEQLCTLLLELHAGGSSNEEAEVADLLWQAHSRLLDMLDQSAAWHEARTDPVLVQRLQDRLERHNGCREPAVAESPVNATTVLREQLRAYVRQLATVLERPVRLQLVTAAVQPDAQTCTQLVACLKPLLKFILLDNAVDTRSRRAVHKPLTSTVSVALHHNRGLLVIDVADDSQERTLAATQLHDLQRRLPKTAGALRCTVRAGQGRCFTFTLE